MRLHSIRNVQDVPLVVKALEANCTLRGSSYAVFQSGSAGEEKAYLLQAPLKDRNMHLLASAQGEPNVSVVYRAGDGATELTGRLTQVREVSTLRAFVAGALAPMGMVTAAAFGVVAAISPDASLSAVVAGAAATFFGSVGMARFFTRSGSSDLAADVVRNATVALADDAQVSRVESGIVSAIPALPPPTPAVFEIPTQVRERV